MFTLAMWLKPHTDRKLRATKLNLARDEKFDSGLGGHLTEKGQTLDKRTDFQHNRINLSIQFRLTHLRNEDFY